jgi:cyclopropane fatty-acyl-phospholipid synthase-like methyltransferase
MNIKNLYNNYGIQYIEQTKYLNYKIIINDRLTELNLWDLIKTKKNILELGCGNGNLTKLIYNNMNDSKLTCIDFSETMLNLLKKWIYNSNIKNIKTILMDIINIKHILNKNIFDLIISAGMIEYIDFENFLKNIKHLANINTDIIFFISKKNIINWLTISLYWKGKIYSKQEILNLLHKTKYKNIEIYDLSKNYLNDWYYIVKCNI